MGWRKCHEVEADADEKRPVQEMEVVTVRGSSAGAFLRGHRVRARETETLTDAFQKRFLFSGTV